MRHYSRKLRESMVAKACSPGGPSVYQLAEESCISPSNLYKWVQAYGGDNRVGKDVSRNFNQLSLISIPTQLKGFRTQRSP